MRIVIMLLVAVTPLAAAQDSTAVEPLDARLFRAVYVQDAPAVAGALRAAEASSLPVMFGAVPTAWAATLAAGLPLDPAARLTASEGAAVLVVFALKNTVRRPRPYRALRDVQARTRRHSHTDVLDPHSFPSGHAAFTFALATSASLSAERWYVTVPAMGFASAVALARVWHGVHYPLDITVGAAIGAGSALLVHALMPSLDGDGEAAVVIPIVVRF